MGRWNMRKKVETHISVEKGLLVLPNS